MSNQRRRICMTLTVIMCLIYLGYRGWYTLNLDSPFAAVFSVTLYFAEIYGNLLMFLYFFQIWNPVYPEPVPPLENAKVDAYIPTYNEEPELLRGTIEAALAMDYPHETYVLDDGNRPEVRELAEELGAKYLCRDSNIHAKAGNLNHAMEITDGDFIIVFDSDHVAERHFITRTLGYFADDDLAFIQTPHSYYNFDSFQGSLNYPKKYYWEEGQLFYNIVQPGKNYWNAASFCGSAAIFRKAALESVGLIATESITEDMQTGLRLHANGWKSMYINERLVSGLAAPDLETFSVQRLRWGEGNLGTIFFDNPITMKGLSLPQRLNYLALMLSWTTGVQKLILYYTPLLMLLSGVGPVSDMTWHLVAITVCYVSAIWYTVKASGNGYGQLIDTEITQMACFWTQCRGTWRALFNRKAATFVVTQKSGGKKETSIHDFLRPQYTFIGTSVIAMTWAASRYFLGVSEDFLGLSICSVLVSFHCLFAWVVIRRALAQRRFDWRHPCAAHIKYEVELSDGVQRGAGFTKDLCETGVGFLCYEKLKGHELNVTVTAGDSAVTLKGRVRNWEQLVQYESRKDGKVTCYRYGVQFVDLTKGQLRSLWHICTKYATGRRYREFDPNVCDDIMDSVRGEKDHLISVPVRLYRPDTGDIETITETITNTEFTIVAKENLAGKELLRMELSTPCGAVTGNARVVNSKAIDLGQMPLFSYRCKIDAFDGQSRGKLTTLLHMSEQPAMETVTTLQPKKTKMPVLLPSTIVGAISAIAASVTIAAALFICGDEVLMARAVLGKPVDEVGRDRLNRLVSYYERNPASNERHFLRLRDAMIALEDKDAVIRLDETLVTHDFESPAARLQQAYVLEMMGRVEDARVAFHRLIDDIEQFASRRTRANLVLAAARNAVNRSDLDEAVRLYDLVWLKKLGYVDIRAEYAGVLAANGQFTRAYDVLTSDDLSPKDQFLQASLLTSMGKYERARRVYSILYQANPSSIRARKGIADVDAWMKRYPTAIASYESILLGHPKHVETKIALTQTLVWDKQYRRALTLAEELVPELETPAHELAVWVPVLEAVGDLHEVEPSDQAFVMRIFGHRNQHAEQEYFLQKLADALINCFAPDRSAPLVEQLISLQPELQPLQVRYAEVLYQMGDFTEAAKHYEQLIAKGALPSDLAKRGSILLAAAFNSSRRGADVEGATRYEAALDCFVELVAANPTDPKYWPPLLDAVAGARDHSSKVEAIVLEIFNTRVSISDDRATMVRLADALSSVGRDRFAKQVLDELSTLHDDVATRWRRANVLLRTGQHEDAKQIYDLLMDEDVFAGDDDAQIRLLMASASNSVKLGDRHDANTMYAKALLQLRGKLQAAPSQAAHWTPFLSAIAGMEACSDHDLAIVFDIYRDRQQLMGNTEFVERLTDVLVAAEKHKMAIPLFEVLVQRRPKSRALRLEYARALQTVHDLVAAEREYQKLLNMKPESAPDVDEYEILLGAAKNADLLGKRRQAVQLFQRALTPLRKRVDRSIEDTSVWVAYLGGLSGIPEIAPAHQQLVLEIYRNRDLYEGGPEFIAQLGYIMTRIDESQSALDMLDQAASRYPENVQLRVELARGFAAVKQHQRADEYFRWLLERSDPNPDRAAQSKLLLEAADNSRKLGDHSRAQEYSSNALAILATQLRKTPDNPALWQPFLDAGSGVHRLSDTDRQLVLQLFTNWRQRTNDPAFIGRLTDNLVKCGDLRRAIILLEQAAVQTSETRMRLAMLLKEVGEHRRAEIRFRELLSRNQFPNDSIQMADLLLAAADNAARLNDTPSSKSRYRSALSLLRKVAPMPSTTEQALRFLAAIAGVGKLGKEDMPTFYHIRRSWPKNPDPHFRTRLVDVLLQLNQPAEALPILESLVAREPTSHSHQLRLADTLQALGQFEEAEVRYQKLIAAGTERMSAEDQRKLWASAARNSLAQKDYSTARTRYEALFDRAEQHREYLVEYAIVLQQTGEQEQAILLLESVPELSLEHQYLLASVYASVKKFDKSREVYTTLLNQAPEDRRAKRGLADVAFWDERYEEAITRYRSLLERDPDDVELQKSLASAMLWNGQGRQALAEFTRLLQTDSGDSSYWLGFLEAAAATPRLNRTQLRLVHELAREITALPLTQSRRLRSRLADVFTSKGEYQKAIDLWEELLASRGPQDDLQVKYAIALVGVGRSEEALPILTRQLRENPRSDQLRRYLANAYFATGDYVRADEQFTLLLDKGSHRSPLTHAYLLLTAGTARAKIGDQEVAKRRFGLALAEVSQLLDRDPQEITLWQPFLDAAASYGVIPEETSGHVLTIFNGRDRHDADLDFLIRLSDVLVLLQRHRDALSILQELALSDPQQIEVQHRLAYTYLALGDYRQSIPLLRQLIANQPNSWTWRTQLASALHAAEQYREAEEIFVQLLTDPDYPGQHLPALVLAGARNSVALEDFREAERRFTRRREMQSDLEADSEYANVLLHLGQPLQAIELLKHRELNLDQKRLLAGAYESAGQPVSARGVYQQILLELPNDDLAMRGLARIALGRARYRRAIGLYEKLRVAHPKDKGLARDKALAHLGTSEFERARSLLEPLVSDNPEDRSLWLPYLHALAGGGDLQQSQLDRAEEIARSISEQADVSRGLLIALADVFLRAGLPNHVLQLIEPYISSFDRMSDLALRFANAALAVGQPGKAIPIYRDWTEREPGRREARFLLALALKEASEHAAADEYFQQILRGKGERKGAWIVAAADNAYLLGNELQSVRLSREATKQLRREYAASPADRQTWKDLIHAIYLSGDESEESTELLDSIYTAAMDETARPVGPQAPLFVALARVLLRSGDKPKAMVVLDRVSRSSIFDTKTQEVFANVLMKVGRHGEAIQQYESLLSDAPTNRRYAVQLAQAHYLTGNHQAAAKYFDPLLKDGNAASANDIGFLLSAAHNSRILGRITESSSRYRDALRVVSSELRLEFEDSHRWIELLYAFSGMDQIEESVADEVGQLVERIYKHRKVVAGGNRAQAREFTLLLARALHRLGQSDRSKVLLLDLLRADKFDVEARLVFAELLQDAGQLSASAEQFDKILKESPFTDDVRRRTQLWMSAAYVYAQLGRKDSASELQREALHDLGHALRDRIDTDLALTYLHAFNAVGQLNAAHSNTVKRIYDGSWKTVGGRSKFVVPLADALTKIGLHEQALDALKISTDPDEICLRMASLLSAIGDFHGALEHYRHAERRHLVKESDPGYMGFRLAFAHALRQVGNEREAYPIFIEGVQHYRTHVSENSNSEEWLPYLHAAQGLRELTEVDDRWIAFALSNLSRFSESPKAMEALCQLAFRWRSTDVALDVVNQAIAVNGETPEILLVKARGLFQLERFKEADALVESMMVSVHRRVDPKYAEYSARTRRELWLTRARIKVALEDYVAARQIFEEIPQVETVACLEYAVMLAKTGDRTRAISLLSDKQPRSREEIGYLVALHAEDKNFQAARQLAEGLLERHQGDVKAQRLLANVMFWAGDFEAASLRFEHLIDQFPDDIDLRESYGKSLLWIGRYDDAIRVLAEIVRDNPNKKDLWIPILEAMMASNTVSLQHPVLLEIRAGYADTPIELQLVLVQRLSQVYLSGREPMLARQCLIPFMEVPDAPPDMTLDYADVLNELEQPDEAIALYRAYLDQHRPELSPAERTELKLRFADALHRAKHYVEAQRELEWALERVDASVPARYRHALLSTARNLVALDRPHEALQRFEELRQLDPNSFDLNEAYAGALLSAGDPQGALEWISKSPDLSLDGQFLLGEVYANLEEYEAAVNVYKHVVEQYPRQLKAWRLLAHAATRSKDFRTAIHVYRQLLARAPQDESLHVAIANAFLLSGEDQRALELYVAILNQSPDRYDLWIALVNAAAGDVQFSSSTGELLNRIVSSRERWPDKLDFKLRMADALFRFGDRRRSLALLHELSREYPRDQEVRRRLADALHRAGQFDAAEQIYNSLLKKRNVPPRVPEKQSPTRHVQLRATP